MDDLQYLVTYDDGESIEEYGELIGKQGAYERFEQLKAKKISCQLYGWDWNGMQYRVLDEFEAPLERFESPYKLICAEGEVDPFESYEEAAKRIEGLMAKGVASELHVWDWLRGVYKPLIVFNPVPMMTIRPGLQN